MLMTEEVMRFWAGTPRLMYASKTEPAIVENPDVMDKWSSESVMTST